MRGEFLYNAINNNDVLAVKKILEASPFINVSYRDPETGNTLLTLAFKKQNKEITEVLFAKLKNIVDLVNTENKEKETPLQIALKNDNEEQLNLLLNNGVEVVLPSEKMDTKCYSILKNCQELGEILVKARIPFNESTKKELDMKKIKELIETGIPLNFKFRISDGSYSYVSNIINIAVNTQNSELIKF